MYDSNNYANQQEIEENRRNPKNRFLGLFCHASDVDDHWGFNWSFKCGVFVFSILIGGCSNAAFYDGQTAIIVEKIRSFKQNESIGSAGISGREIIEYAFGLL